MTSLICFLIIWHRYRFLVVMRLFSSISQKTSNCGKDFCDTPVRHFILVFTTFWCHRLSFSEQTEQGIYLLISEYECLWSLTVERQVVEDSQETLFSLGTVQGFSGVLWGGFWGPCPATLEIRNYDYETWRIDILFVWLIDFVVTLDIAETVCHCYGL